MSIALPTFDDLVADLTDELGEDSSDTEATTRIGRWLNDVFNDVLSRRPDWRWARGVRELVLVPPYQTGTVDVVNGSATVNGTGTTWDITWVDRVFWISGSSAIYRVAAVVSATELTLETAWQEDSASTQVYVLVQDRYPLRNEDYQAGLFQVVNPYSQDILDELDMKDFVREYPTLQDITDPDAYSVWGQDDTNQLYVYFNAFPAAARKFYYLHHKQFDVFSGTMTFPIPYKFYRNLFRTGVKAIAKEFDSTIPEEVSQKYEAIIALMARENTITASRTHRMKESDVPKEGSGLRLPGMYPKLQY